MIGLGKLACMKQTIWLVMILLSMSLVSAMNLCLKEQPSYQNCTMFTPALNCTTYTYQVINITGEAIENGTLSLLYNDIYSFNFTKPVGDYIVRLCDGTTREISITEGDDGVIPAALIILPMLFGLIIIVGAGMIKDEHKELSMFLWLLSLLSFFVSLWFGLLSVVKFYQWNAMQEALGDVSMIFTWVFFAIIIYVILWIIKLVMDYAAGKNKKKDSYEDEYDN